MEGKVYPEGTRRRRMVRGDNIYSERNYSDKGSGNVHSLSGEDFVALRNPT